MDQISIILINNTIKLVKVTDIQIKKLKNSKDKAWHLEKAVIKILTSSTHKILSNNILKTIKW